jgi:FkbM family methyltransferase
MYKTYFRDTIIDGVGSWMWREADSGAWDGPSREWQETHKAAYIKHCKKFDCVVQAGGNQGLYPRLFSNIFKTVYTFEPDSYNFHCLVNNCQSKNIIKMNACLGNENKLVRFDGDEDSTNSGTFTVGKELGIVPMLTLDTLKLQECDLIQLDVERFEKTVLEGAVETIKRFKPVIACESGDGGFLSQFGYVSAESVGADTIYIPT